MLTPSLNPETAHRVPQALGLRFDLGSLMGWRDSLDPVFWAPERQAQATPEILHAKRAVKNTGSGVRMSGFKPQPYQLGQLLFLVKPPFLCVRSGNCRNLPTRGVVEGLWEIMNAYSLKCKLHEHRDSICFLHQSNAWHIVGFQ